MWKDFSPHPFDLDLFLFHSALVLSTRTLYAGRHLADKRDSQMSMSRAARPALSEASDVTVPHRLKREGKVLRGIEMLCGG